MIILEIQSKIEFLCLNLQSIFQYVKMIYNVFKIHGNKLEMSSMSSTKLMHQTNVRLKQSRLTLGIALPHSNYGKQGQHK